MNMNMNLTKHVMRKVLLATRLAVVADATDFSVSLSPRLIKHLRRHSRASDQEQYVFSFRICGGQLDGLYAFTTDHNFQVDDPDNPPTRLAPLQYSTLAKEVGFSSQNPTVAKIFYDYGISGQVAVLKVVPFKSGQMQCYAMLKPTGKK